VKSSHALRTPIPISPSFLQQVTNIEDFGRLTGSLNSPSLPAYSPALQSPVLRRLRDRSFGRLICVGLEVLDFRFGGCELIQEANPAIIFMFSFEQSRRVR
jgi:hypothetical protein